MESQNRLKEYTDTNLNKDSKFYNFSIYLFDTETLTLYYIHNNI